MVGEGSRTSAWYDSWNDFGPLADVISHKEMHRHSYTESTLVLHLRNQNNWLWPPEWISKYPMLAAIPFPDLTQQDKVYWRDFEGNMVQFSSKVAWDTLRPHASEVVWYHMVWFSNYIPRHAFITWLLMRDK
ncbi:uncharacterized protein [Rutidosis leptorrhynchoides]|uniref:uncharacterized protein n=1 Tax=Rutidosis leptorrhynchoides TaxID=125765 RepID=UPI003A99A389